MHPTAPGTTPARRCFGDGDPLYESYHDAEWGLPVRGERELFERLSLEAFQTGLSWLTILRKRPAFRSAFAGFDPQVVAAFGSADVDRLVADAAIVRNRAKIRATIANARAVLGLWADGRTLTALCWSHAPAVEPARQRPTTWAVVPSQTQASRSLARELRAAGFTFVGPTTAYAAMQACGLVDDHLAGCPVVLGQSLPGQSLLGQSLPGQSLPGPAQTGRAQTP
jgi:DNA-3-methyladenine glycosylase I